jgi:MoaA/NifB/PqqE/SkfB family radical SAM enzyme
MTEKVPQGLTDEIRKARERLRATKPQAFGKLMTYLNKEADGEQAAMSLVDWTFGFECNFRCPHCCANVFQGNLRQPRMSRDQIREVADQVDELGVFVINLIGGEPLIWKDLDTIVEDLDPTRFHLSLTTNGWHLTPAMADRLVSLGIDKVGISIDSGLAEEHDSFRNRQGSYRRALRGVRNATAKGIRTLISTVVTHQNIHGEGFKRLLNLSKELDVGLDLQCATVSGGWRGVLDVLIDAEDAKFLDSLREEYPLTRRDVWTTPGSKGGCPAVKRSLFIIPSGDVLPCLFIHCSLGNIFEESLEVIHKRGLQVKDLSKFSSLCLAGEDLDFINKYLTKTFDARELPLSFENSFGQ